LGQNAADDLFSLLLFLLCLLLLDFVHDNEWMRFFSFSLLLHLPFFLFSCVEMGSFLLLEDLVLFLGAVQKVWCFYFSFLSLLVLLFGMGLAFVYLYLGYHWTRFFFFTMGIFNKWAFLEVFFSYRRLLLSCFKICVL